MFMGEFQFGSTFSLIVFRLAVVIVCLHTCSNTGLTGLTFFVWITLHNFIVDDNIHYPLFDLQHALECGWIRADLENPFHSKAKTKTRRFPTC